MQFSGRSGLRAAPHTCTGLFLMEISHVITILLAAGGGLTAAIGVLYRTVQNLNKEQSQLKHDFGELKGKHRGIEQLSADVLATVHRATIESIYPKAKALNELDEREANK